MKIFIPTLDEQSSYAELIYKLYSKVYWNKDYLEYYIPYKDSGKMTSYNFFAKQNNVKLVRVGERSDITRVMSELLRFADNDEWIFWAPHSYYPSPFPPKKDKNFLHNVHDYIIKSSIDIDAIYLEAVDLYGRRPRNIDKNKKIFIDKGRFNKELIRPDFNPARHCFAKGYFIKKFYLKNLDPKYMSKNTKETLSINKNKFDVYTLVNDRIYYEKIFKQENGLMCRNISIALWQYSCKKYNDIFDFTKSYKF